MARPRASVAPLVILGVLLVGAAGWLLLDDPAGGGGDARLPERAGERGGAASATPAPLESGASERIQRPAPAAPDQAARFAALAETLPLRRLHGTVRRADGGPLPAGLTVCATHDRPYPRVLEGAVASRPSPYEALTADDDAALDVAAFSRTPVDAEGRFVMERFPSAGAWLQVEHPLWFTREPVDAPPGVDHVELVLEHGALVEGVVRGPDGAPAAGQSLRASTPLDPWRIFEAGLRVARSGSAQSGADGRFVLGPLPPEMELTLRASGGHGLQPGARELAPLAPGERRAVELRLEPGATVVGRVLDEADAPVPSARVKLMPAALDLAKLDMGGDDPGEETRTDTEGRFRFANLPAGRYRLVLAAGGYVPQIGEQPFELAAGQTREGFTLRARRGASLRGHVVSAATGAPVAGAKVVGARRPSMMDMRANVDGSYREAVATDADGAFELHGFEHDELRLSVSAKGFVRAVHETTLDAEQVLVELAEPASISGVVVSLESAEPVDDYLLTVVPSAGLFDPMAFATLTSGPPPEPPRRVRDPEGRFRIDDLDPGRYDLTVTAAGHARAKLAGVELAAGQRADGLVIYARPESRVTGRVVAGDTGRPVPGAYLTTGRNDIASRLTATLTQPGPSTRTDAEGFFELGELGGDGLTLSVRHRAFVDLSLPPLQLADGEQRDLGELELARGGAVFGTLVDGFGAPQAGVTVLVGNALGTILERARSDAEGRWRVEGLPAGTYNVTRMDFRLDTNAAAAASMLEGLVSKVVTLAADEQRRVDLVTEPEGGTLLEGDVRSRAGPVANATLVVMPDRGGLQPRFGGTDAEGHYELRGLSEGPWLVQVFPTDLESSVGAQGMAGAPVIELVDVGAGPRQRHDIHVPGGRLAGRVVAADDGRPLGGVRVILERADVAGSPSRILAATGGRMGETYTGPEGDFAFSHLASGLYDVAAGGTNLLGMGDTGWAQKRLEDVEVHASRADFRVELELEPGAALVGTVSDPAGAPLAEVPVWARHDPTGRWLSMFSETQTDNAGEYRLTGLEPGSWTLVFGGTDRALHVAPGRVARRGAEETVDVVLVEGAEIVLERAGGLAGVAVQLSGDVGVLPTELGSLAELMAGGSANAGQRRLARVAPGAYRVVAHEGGELLIDKTVVVSPGAEQVVVSLDGPD